MSNGFPYFIVSYIPLQTSKKLKILDEPMNALDEKGIAMVGQLILMLKQKGSLVILSNHDSQDLNQFSDEVFVLVDGKIVNSYIPAKHEEKIP